MSKFPNLKIISRDRGVQYRNIDEKYIHIADRFHLITNLSEIMIERIKNTLPRKIKISEDDKSEYIEYQQKCEAIIDSNTCGRDLSPQQQQKLDLILEIKEHFKAGISIHQIALYYGMSRNTIRKYIQLENPQAKLQNVSRRETILFLDTISQRIDSLCKECSTATEITYLLQEEYGDKVTYSKLIRYMKKHDLKPRQKEVKEKLIRGKLKLRGTEISRAKIIKYIFSWKLKNTDEELILNNIKSLTDKYPIIALFKEFYGRFKMLLLQSKYEELEKVLNSTYEDITLNKYIKSLNTDSQAVLHAAQYTYSNGVTEGNVNKLKKIKRDMYNRASIRLLRNKVIFQSLYF